MITLDILLQEQLNGGEAVLLGDDVVTVNGYENLVYLSLFGGDEWVFNYLLNNKYACRTGRAIRKHALNSSGRVLIEQAVKADLDDSLKDIPNTTYSASVTITGHNSIQIAIVVNGEEFYYNIDKDKIAL